MNSCVLAELRICLSLMFERYLVFWRVFHEKGSMLQINSGQVCEFAPEDPIRLPHGQTSILTLPYFYAMPVNWGAPTAQQIDTGSSRLELSLRVLPLHGLQMSRQNALPKVKLVAGSALFPI